MTGVLRSVRVGLREDLDITRHLFRGEVAYIVRDPLTFQSQRLDHADYAVLVRIDVSRPLSEVFEELVATGTLTPGDEESFYRFVMRLHQLGFLHLPIADDRQLYRRYRMRQLSRRREKLLGFLFLRIPLWNPDAFLNKTVRYFHFLFSRWFFVLWVVVIASAGYVVLRNWSDLLDPLAGTLSTGNLPLIGLILLILKFFHEMGHAYACKHYGGEVPEMGAFLIVFAPCAYMDASACWGFTSKRARLIVCLAGMYVEMFLAAIAVFVWATTGSSFVHGVAYNVILLASVVTILFNVNPFARFDGYYVASDLLEIPNLRQRSREYNLGLLKRYVLGMPSSGESVGIRHSLTLSLYGICATIYRFSLMIAIVAMLATKMFVVGIGMGIMFVGMTLLSMFRSLTGYLWYAQETAHIRARGVVISLVALIALPAGLSFVPIASYERAPALVGAQHETVVRSRTPGFVSEVPVRIGSHIQTGDPVVRLTNDSVTEWIAEVEGKQRAAEIRREAYLVSDPARATQEQVYLRTFEKSMRQALARKDDLAIDAPNVGFVVASLKDVDAGRFLAEGSPVATIVAGRWEVRAILTEEQITRTHAQVGDNVEFRPARDPGQVLRGVISRIAPSGYKGISLTQLTDQGGGEVTVNPDTGDAAEPYFEMTVDLYDASQDTLKFGATGTVRIAADAEPVAGSVARRLMRFWNKLRKS